MRVPKLLTVTLLQTRQRPVPNPIRQRQSSSRLARFPRFEATALTQNRTSLDPARQDGNPAASSSLTTLTIVHSELGSDALVKALEKGKFRRLHFCRPRHLGTAYQAMEHERGGRSQAAVNQLARASFRFKTKGGAGEGKTPTGPERPPALPDRVSLDSWLEI